MYGCPTLVYRVRHDDNGISRVIKLIASLATPCETTPRVRFILNFPKDSLIKNRDVFKPQDGGKYHVALNRDTPRVEGAQDLLN